MTMSVTATQPEIKDSILEAIGHTPLVRLSRMAAGLRPQVVAKVESLNPGGSISLTGGIAGARPGKGWSVASSICGMMEGFTRAMAVELAPIRVNCVVPGVIRTGLWSSMSEVDREQLYTSVANSLLLQRVGEASDIAQTFCYLMKQTFGTGQCLTVDGGAVLV